MKSVKINQRKKCFEIELRNGKEYTFPLSRLMEDVSNNKVVKAFVDPELGNEGITYFLEDGTECGLHLDSVLEVNGDAAHLKKIMLYNMTQKAKDCVKESGLTKREIARRLNTSPTQLYRILDQTNYKKTLDQVLKVLYVCGAKVDFVVK